MSLTRNCRSDLLDRVELTGWRLQGLRAHLSLEIHDHDNEPSK
jgi:hypothetical protein